jgi:hypothetical protein
MASMTSDNRPLGDIMDDVIYLQRVSNIAGWGEAIEAKNYTLESYTDSGIRTWDLRGLGH